MSETRKQINSQPFCGDMLRFEVSDISVDFSDEPVAIEFADKDRRSFFGFMAEGSSSTRLKNPPRVRASWHNESSAFDEVVMSLETVTVSRTMFRAAFLAHKGNALVSVEIHWTYDAGMLADLLEGLRSLLGKRIDILRLDIPGAPDHLSYLPTAGNRSKNTDDYQ